MSITKEQVLKLWETMEGIGQQIVVEGSECTEKEGVCSICGGVQPSCCEDECLEREPPCLRRKVIEVRWKAEEVQRVLEEEYADCFED